MSTTLAAVMPKPDAPVEVRELPLPELEENSALMRVELSEVCGTDVFLREGRLAEVPYPIIPGHVSVGTIESLRGRMDDIEGNPVREGDRVTFLDVHKTCHTCWHCLVAKASTRCPHRKVYGITYGLDDGLTGGWARHLYFKPGVRIIRTDRLDAERYMSGGCSLPTSLHATDLARVKPGDSVLVLGSGPVGLSSIIFAKMNGALDVLCIGAPDARLDIARKVGASATLNFLDTDENTRRDWVLDHTGGRGADITIEATGAPSAVVDAMRFTRDAGRVVVVGQYTDHGEIGLNPHLDLNKKHLEVLGCWGSDFSHFYRGVQILSSPERAAPWGHIALDRYSLADANSALDLVRSGKITKALIDPWMEPDNG
ncbi:MAG: zinc-binding dehydrogenase [Planctomycetota bacterium]|jgi:L-iditol 2-dehydrogenase